MPTDTELGGGSVPDPGRGSLRQTLDLLLSMGQELRFTQPERGADCLRQAVGLARKLEDRREEGRALFLWGSIETRLGHLTEAEPLLSRALELARRAGAPAGVVACTNAFAYLELRRGRIEDGLSNLRESLAASAGISEDPAHPALRAETLELLGWAYGRKGEPVEAIRYYQDALELRRGGTDKGDVAKVLNLLGGLHHRLGNYQASASCYEDSLEIRRALRDVRGVAAAANNLASTLLRLGDAERARTLLEECRERFLELGESGRVADVLTNLGLLAQSRGRMEEARGLYQEGLQRRRELGDLAAQANSCLNLSHLAVESGRYEEAISLADQGLELLGDGGAEAVLSTALVSKGRALLELGRLAEAHQVALSAQEAARRIKAKDQVAEALVLHARILDLEGNSDDAVRAAGQAVSLAEEIHDPEMLAISYRALGTVQRSAGCLDEAKQALAQASRLRRAWEGSYERTRALYEEGCLLARAGAAEAAAERLRRAAGGFEAMGNAWWHAKALLCLSKAIEPIDPGMAGDHRAQARLVAATHPQSALLQRTLHNMASVQPSENQAETGASPGAATAGHAAAVVALARAWLEAAASPEQSPAPFLDPFFAFLRRRLGVNRAHLCLRSPPAPRWSSSMPGVDGENYLFAGSGVEAVPRRDLPFSLALVVETPSGPRPGVRPEPDRTLALGLPSAPLGWLHLERTGGRGLDGEEASALEFALCALALALEALFARTERLHLAPEVSSEEGRFEFLIGSSAPMREVYRLIAHVAGTDSSVLLLGESGTGKELAARSIHARSLRREGPLVAISCPSIPRDLIESELFGYERGAFTGAVATRPGRIEQADHGTLFLDEVGDMPGATQAKILRFLQEREFERVGGRTPLRVDVRVLSATSRDLKEAMERGEFRPDLYYRLNVVPIRLPSLRERHPDIPMLVDHFLRVLGRGTDVRTPRVSAAVLDRLLAYDWPGNLRELRNTIEYMTTVAGGEMLELRHLPASLLKSPAGAKGGVARVSGRPEQTPSPDGDGKIGPGETLESRLVELEARMIRGALEAESWNQSAAARRLGLAESTLRSRMERYGLQRSGKRRAAGGRTP